MGLLLGLRHTGSGGTRRRRTEPTVPSNGPANQIRGGQRVNYRHGSQRP